MPPKTVKKKTGIRKRRYRTGGASQHQQTMHSATLLSAPMRQHATKEDFLKLCIENIEDLLVLIKNLNKTIYEIYKEDKKIARIEKNTQNLQYKSKLDDLEAEISLKVVGLQYKYFLILSPEKLQIALKLSPPPDGRFRKILKGIYSYRVVYDSLKHELDKLYKKLLSEPIQHITKNVNIAKSYLNKDINSAFERIKTILQLICIDKDSQNKTLEGKIKNYLTEARKAIELKVLSKSQNEFINF